MSQVYGSTEWRLGRLTVARDGSYVMTIILPFIESKDELLNGPKIPHRPNLPGFPAPKGGEMIKREDGGAEIEWTYEFMPPEKGMGKDDKANWRVDANFRQRHILEHPDIKRLMEKYGWDEKDKAFPREMPGSDGGSGFSKGDEGKKSPMFGKQSFDDVSSTLVHTYYTETLSGINKDRYAIKPTPCPFMSSEPGRDWLGLPAKADPCGDGWRVTQPWLLSAAGGHNKEIIEPLRKGGA